FPSILMSVGFLTGDLRSQQSTQSSLYFRPGNSVQQDPLSPCQSSPGLYIQESRGRRRHPHFLLFEYLVLCDRWLFLFLAETKREVRYRVAISGRQAHGLFESEGSSLFQRHLHWGLALHRADRPAHPLTSLPQEPTSETIPHTETIDLSSREAGRSP